MSYAKAQALLQHLDKVRQCGDDKWMACCPAHDDRTPSLSIRAEHERVLVHCFAGCKIEDVMAAVGMRTADLFEGDATGGQLRRQQRGRPTFDIQQEQLVIRCAVSDLEAGRKISLEDRARIELARQRLTGGA